MINETINLVMKEIDNQWYSLSEKPPLHQQVLVELKEGPGQVCDVACYIGEINTPDGRESRWIMSDVRLDSRQIARWAYIYPKPPRNELELLKDLVKVQKNRIKELEEVIKPFVQETETWDDTVPNHARILYIDTDNELPNVTLKDFRHARDIYKRD